MGWVWSAQGRHEDGIAALRETISAYQALGSRHAHTCWCAWLAEAYLNVGRAAEAAAVIEIARKKGFEHVASGPVDLPDAVRGRAGGLSPPQHAFAGLSADAPPGRTQLASIGLELALAAPHSLFSLIKLALFCKFKFLEGCRSSNSTQLNASDVQIGLHRRAVKVVRSGTE